MTHFIRWYDSALAREVCRKSMSRFEGRLAFFPVCWTYRHRGAPPESGPKDVCTTFIHPRF